MKRPVSPSPEELGIATGALRTYLIALEGYTAVLAATARAVAAELRYEAENRSASDLLALAVEIEHAIGETA